MADAGEAQSPSTEERRQHDRSRLNVDVHFDGAASTGVASTKDISAGGLYMSTQTAIPVGVTLALRIPIGPDHVLVTGEVVHGNPGEGVGVKLQDLPEEVKRAFESGLSHA